MVRLYNETLAEKAQWDYAAKHACRRVCGACCGVSCETGVISAVTLVWLIVFTPRCVNRLLWYGTRLAFKALKDETTARLFVNFMRFFMRWLSLVVFGAVMGVAGRAILGIIVHMSATTWCVCSVVCMGKVG